MQIDASASGSAATPWKRANVEFRLVSATNPDRVKALGGRYAFVRPSSEQLAELGRFAGALD